MSKPSILHRILPPLALLPVLLLAACALPQRIGPDGQPLATGATPDTAVSAPPPITETPLTGDGQAPRTSDLASAEPTANAAAVSPESAPAPAVPTAPVPEPATVAAAASSPASPATRAAPATAVAFALPNLPALPPQGGAPVNAAPAQVVAEAQPPASTSGQSAAHTLARESLERARNRLNLSAEDRQRIQAIGQELGADPAAAYLAATKLDQRLAAASRTYQVQGDETLSQIAEKSDIYGNAYLWPLLVQANPKKLKNPQAVYNGLQIKVPLHPTAGEVAAALEQTHRLAATSATAAKPVAASGN